MGQAQADNELVKLTQVLEKLVKKRDVRKYISKFVLRDPTHQMDMLGKCAKA